MLFYECFHGDDGRGVGASHQTGWTALALKFLENARRAAQGAGARRPDPASPGARGTPGAVPAR